MRAPIIYPGCNKAYPFYVVNLETGTVVSGWEFRSDAKDDLDERPDNYACEVWSAGRVRSAGLPGDLECACGRYVQLRAFTNACDCGADYNRTGERLTPRSDWGSETGEHWTDCT